MKKSITGRLILGSPFLEKTDLRGGEDGLTAAEFLQLFAATDYTSTIDQSVAIFGRSISEDPTTRAAKGRMLSHARSIRCPSRQIRDVPYIGAVFFLSIMNRVVDAFQNPSDLGGRVAGPSFACPR
jgi:hypothetical protein